MSLSPSSMTHLQKVIIAAIKEQDTYIVKDPNVIRLMDNQKPISSLEPIVDDENKNTMMSFFGMRKKK